MLARSWTGLSPRRRGLLAGVVAVVALLLVAGVVQVVQGTRGPAGVPAQDVPGAVLLVPGCGGGRDVESIP